MLSRLLVAVPEALEARDSCFLLT